MSMRLGVARVSAVWIVLLGASQTSFGWGSDGHRMINRLAIATLPREVPAFLRDGNALDVVEYLGPEPDRWRSRAEEELSAEQAPEHFIDLELADMVKPLPKRRYDFLRALAGVQAAHPEMPLTPEKVGLQPWETEEVWERLKAAMREYRGLLEAKEDTRPVESTILFYAGWLGHYVGDGSQPLHVTVQYNGWTGPNPKGYTTEHTIHAEFETTFVGANIRRAEVAPLVEAAKPMVLHDEWDDYLAYLRHSGSLVEETYQLEKAGGFRGAGTPAGKQFAEERLAAGAIELRDLIYTAWVRSGDPVPEARGAS